MRFLSLVLFLCLLAPCAGAIEINRTVDSVPAANVPPPDGAPPLPPAADQPAPSLPHFQVAQPAPGEPSGQPVQLSADNLNDISRIESYLNALKSISADFLQVDDQGNVQRGSIDIQRPGKMRVVYAPPSKDFIVADGDYVHIWDGSLKSQTNLPENASLADFILRDKVAFSGDVTVTRFQRFPQKLEVTLVQTKDPGAGQLTLVFEDNPLLLRQWKVVDAQGRTTGVNLENERMDVSFHPGTFSFVPPNFGKGGKAESR